MGSRHHDGILITNHPGTNKFGQGNKLKPPVKHRFNFGIAAGKGITYNNDSIRVIQVCRIKTGKIRYFMCRKHIAHRRINVLIGPGYIVTGIFQRNGGSTHCRTSNANKIKRPV